MSIRVKQYGFIVTIDWLGKVFVYGSIKLYLAGTRNKCPKKRAGYKENIIYNSSKNKTKQNKKQSKTNKNFRVY